MASAPARRIPAEPPSYIFTAMYWPLLGGFVVFVLIAIFMGWVMDTSRHGDHDRH